MICFVGAGPGAVDLISVRGARLLGEADLIIHAGSLVNPELLALAKPTALCLDSSTMVLEEVIAAMTAAEVEGKLTVRLHSGDPSLFGAIGEQMAALRERGIGFAVTPGISSFAAAAAALEAEYTLPGISQTLIICRLAGRTPVPEREELSRLAGLGTSMAIFLSAGMLREVETCLLRGGAYRPDTPAAIVYKASWPDELVLPCLVGMLAETGTKHNISKTALVLVGDFLGGGRERSRLYHPSFATGCREARP